MVRLVLWELRDQLDLLVLLAALGNEVLEVFLVQLDLLEAPDLRVRLVLWDLSALRDSQDLLGQRALQDLMELLEQRETQVFRVTLGYRVRRVP